MSQSDPEAVTVFESGFTVEKTLNTEDFQTLAIVFEISADADAEGPLVLTDTLPEGLPLDDVGFHPKYGAEYWTAEGRQVVFERDFEPGEEYTTIYGLRNYEPESVEQPLSEPTLEVPGGAEPGGQDEPAEPADDAGDEVGPDIDTTPGDDPEAEAAVEPDEPADGAGSDAAAGTPDVEAGDTAVEDEEGTPAETPGHEAGASETAESMPAVGGVGRVLAKELREGRIAEEDRQTLREELLAEPNSTEVRVEQLETRVSELDAYTDALEDFIDEHGTKDILSDIEADIESLRTEVDTVSNDVDAVEAYVEDVEADVDDLSAELDRIDDLEEDLDAEVERLEDELEAIDEELDELAEFRERLSSALGAYGGETDDEE